MAVNGIKIRDSNDMDYEGTMVFNLNEKQAKAVLTQNDYSQAFNSV